MQSPRKSNQWWMVWLVVVVWILALGQIAWSWNSGVNISQNEGNSYRPAIAVDSANTIHVVWSDNSINYPGNTEILYKTSSNGGTTWSSAQNLSNTANESVRPMIAAAGPNAVAVAWIDSGQIHARIWNGTTWSPAMPLSAGSVATQRLSIAINQSGVAIAAWSEGLPVELYGSGGPPSAGYLYSRWNGSAWSAPVAMTGRLVAMRGNLAYLVTSQRTLLRSTDAGATWGSPIALPQDYIVPDDMKIDSQNRLRMAWLGPTLNAVYAATYNGQVFGAPALVSTGGDPNTYKQLSLALNKYDELALTWTKNIIVPSNAYPGAMRRVLQVLASQSADGQSWTAPANILSDSGCFPTVAGSPIDTRFYGTWQSPSCFTGQTTDIYVASQNGIFHPGPTFAISGRVLAYGGTPLAGVTVSAGTASSALTDANGNYAVTGLITGTYTLTAAKSGYRFSSLPPAAVPPSRAGQNFTGTLISTDENTPLIFIPGIMGSVLRTQQDRRELWPAPFDFGNVGKQNLKLPSNLQIVATYAITSITNPLTHKPEFFYEPLLNRLRSAGYQERMINATRTPLERCSGSGQATKLYVFAYDWRKEITENAEELKKLVDCVRNEHQGVDVNILAHSMGGLVARRYILGNPPVASGQTAHHVSKLITIGSPWLGAPKALNALLTGDAFDLKGYVALLMLPGQVRALVETFPGSHELLPSRAFFDLGGRPYLEGGVLGIGTKIYEYADYERLLDTSYADSEPDPPGTTNRKFHTDVASQDDWRLDKSGVRYYHIYGVGKSDDTMVSLHYGLHSTCLPAPPLTILTCLLTLGYDPHFGRGDQTVPRLSARRIETSDLNAPRDRTTLWAVMADRGNGMSDGDTEHLEMTKNTKVQNCILAALRPGSQSCALSTTPRTTVPGTTPAQTEPPAQPAYYLDIRGTGAVTARDVLGNSTDSMSGTLTTRIPDAALYRLGDQAQMLVMPTNQTYTITLRSGNAPLAIELTKGTEASKSQAIRYRDLVLPPNVTAMFRITSQGIENLRYDADGNGSFETVVTPTVSVSGPQAADVTPPTITITKTGPLARTLVTLAASDTGSGVKVVRYSLDRTHYQIYTGPIQVNAPLTPVVYVFADDNVANRSAVVTYQLARQVYLPLTRR